MMKRVVVDHFGGPEVLRVVEEDDPRPGPGEVRVRVLAAGVSYTDAMLRAGSYLGVPNPPFTPGYELVGVVEELGPGCTRLRVGDRVGALTVWGADAERVCVPEAGAVEVPEDLDPGEVLSLVFIYMTAYQLLHRTAQVKPGEAVLVHGAAGGVGTACIQVARALGAGTIIGVASGRERMAVAMAAGADHALDAGEDWVGAVRELTGGRGADVVCDPVGGEAFAQSLRCMAPEGRLLVIGFATGSIPTVEANRLLLRHHEVVGVNWGGMLPLDQELPVKAARDLHRWLEKGYLRPVVGERYRLEDGARALEDFAARRVTGKPVLLVR
jgi:NADPH:quinone reductase-like Zn-dependent oxidoreductase